MKTSLLACAAGLLLATQGGAATLLQENFDALKTGNYTTGQTAGRFTVVANDVDIFGVPGTQYACPSGATAGNNCLDLNGNRNGRIVSDLLSVTGGTTYTISFDLAGNGQPFFPSATSPYTLDVSFAGVTRSFEVAPLAASSIVSFEVTAASSLATNLVFQSTSTNEPTYWGAILDDISVTAPDVAAVPEPASWAMMMVGFGVAGGSLRRRRAATQFLAQRD